MKKFLLLSLLAFICLTRTFSQCITFQNPSFEGVISDSTPPSYWTGCTTGYELTFPVVDDATIPAFSGNTYLGLYYSDNGGAIAKGAVSQRMNTPFVPNVAYTLTIALADIPKANPTQSDAAQVQIYGGYALCETHELLWEDTSIIPPPVVNNTPHWTQYTFVIRPAFPDTFITIMVNSEVSPTGSYFWIGVDSLTISCNNTTGFDQISAPHISLYPNPATNTVTISSDSNEQYTLNLYDLTGREVAIQEMTGTSTITLSGLAKGCYLAKVIQGDKSYCQKLIIE